MKMMIVLHRKQIYGPPIPVTEIALLFNCLWYLRRTAEVSVVKVVCTPAPLHPCSPAPLGTALVFSSSSQFFCNVALLLRIRQVGHFFSFLPISRFPFVSHSVKLLPAE
jgi:hypothetical protein